MWVIEEIKAPPQANTALSVFTQTLFEAVMSPGWWVVIGETASGKKINGESKGKERVEVEVSQWVVRLKMSELMNSEFDTLTVVLTCNDHTRLHKKSAHN